MVDEETGFGEVDNRPEEFLEIVISLEDEIRVGKNGEIEDDSEGEKCEKDFGF